MGVILAKREKVDYSNDLSGIADFTDKRLKRPPKVPLGVKIRADIRELAIRHLHGELSEITEQALKMVLFRMGYVDEKGEPKQTPKK